MRVLLLYAEPWDVQMLYQNTPQYTCGLQLSTDLDYKYDDQRGTGNQWWVNTMGSMPQHVDMVMPKQSKMRYMMMELGIIKKSG